MKEVRVWFNRWFSVAYHYMTMIRDNEDGNKFRLYGTHPDRNHMSLQACDYAETEPALKGDEYVEFCLEFCREHEIDVFIPRLHMLDIAKNIDRFETQGTQVMVCRDTELLERMMVKQKFYESVALTQVMEIPEYEVVDNAEDFRKAYEKLAAKGHRVCFKPTSAEGGMGFRIIDNERDELNDLFGAVHRYMSIDQVCGILAKAGTFDELMVMEHLDGYEYSIDCLATKHGELVAAVPRRKAGGRLRLLEENEELLAIANRVAAAYKIPYNYNIQMKYKDGVPKLLEINPRMSGGLHVSCLSGINFPYLAVQLLLDEAIPVLKPKYNILASHVEKPMLMQTF